MPTAQQIDDYIIGSMAGDPRFANYNGPAASSYEAQGLRFGSESPGARAMAADALKYLGMSKEQWINEYMNAKNPETGEYIHGEPNYRIGNNFMTPDDQKDDGMMVMSALMAAFGGGVGAWAGGAGSAAAGGLNAGAGLTETGWGFGAGGLGGDAAGLAGALGGGADAAWGVNQGAGMDLGDWQNWGDLLGSNGGGSLMPPAQLDPSVAEWLKAGNTAGGGSIFTADGLNPSVLGLGGEAGSIWDTLRQLPTSALKALGITKPDGSTDSNALLRILGQLGATGLGIYGANQQADKLGTLSQQYAGYGAPYRDRLAASYADPAGFLANSPDIKASVDQGTSALARALSTKGNPTGSGSALQELQNYATQGLYGQLGNERNRLANFGGLSNFNAAAPGLAGQQIQAQGGALNAIGSGISAVTNPPTTLEQALNAMNSNNFKINNGTGL